MRLRLCGFAPGNCSLSGDSGRGRCFGIFYSRGPDETPRLSFYGLTKLFDVLPDGLQIGQDELQFLG